MSDSKIYKAIVIKVACFLGRKTDIQKKEYSEKDPQIYGRLIFNKNSEAIKNYKAVR